MNRTKKYPFRGKSIAFYLDNLKIHQAIFKLMVTLTVSIIFLSCSNEELKEVRYENGQLKEQYYLKLDNQKNYLMTGLYKKWYENGQLEAQGEFINRPLKDTTMGATGVPIGYRNGEWVFWHENGNKSSESNYAEGKIEGKYISWYPSGNKKYEANYINGQYEGQNISWYENGNKKAEAHYINGKLEGVATRWFENGAKQKETPFKNNKPEGLDITYYENGNKKLEINFKNGVENGLYSVWYLNGELFSTHNYTNGEMTSTEYQDSNPSSDKVLILEDYYENGKLQEFRHISIDKDGKQYNNGIRQRFYENGNIKSEFNYKNGVLEGKMTSWYENGNIETELYNKNGELEGLCYVWYENGSKNSEENYKKGKLEGLCSIWYENGNKKSEKNYKNGKLYGTAVMWSEQGDKEAEFQYKNDKMNGICTIWKNNKIISQIEYRDDEEYNVIHKELPSMMSLNDFRKEVIGKTMDQVKNMMGTPDEVIDLTRMKYWVYTSGGNSNTKIYDEDNGKQYSQVQVVFVSGYVNRVNAL